MLRVPRVSHVPAQSGLQAMSPHPVVAPLPGLPAVALALVPRVVGPAGVLPTVDRPTGISPAVIDVRHDVFSYLE